ncbi:hypothetical protein WJX74_003112 [Apatococcus lobatus]|uniref:UV-stimulated scaffold protein A n=1 Tax=Apatococcus lobatus TaxID=904363 RepID=A0AAW1QWX7_9CHLO
MLDHESHQRLAKLVEELTDKKRMDREPQLLRKLKGLCKVSDANIATCFELLLDRLKCPHAQVRLHTVALDHELFMRSRAFRRLMAQRFSRFLELAVGHRTENPLPGPQDVAVQLRELALETIEIWTERFGLLHRQVQLGHHYLKHTLNFRFPELRARAATAEADNRAREARARQLVEDKYQRIQAEFPAFLRATTGLLAQQDRCLQLLQGKESPAIQLAHGPDNAEGDGADEWEDIGAPLNPPGETDREGLSAYADQALPDELLGIGQALQICVRDQSVIEALHGLHRELQGATLATLQDWLRNLVKVDAGPVGGPPYAIKEHLLRSALELRGRLTAAGERFAEAESQLKVTDAFGHPDLHASISIASSPVFMQSSHQEPARESGGNLKGTSSRHNGSTNSLGEAWPSFADSDTEDDAPLGARQQPAARLPISVDASLAAAQDVVRVQASQACAAGKAGPGSKNGALPDSIKEQLLKQAPVIPGGSHLAYWDSDKAGAMVDSRALEISNHWGPVDAQAELPAERLSELFGTVASYVTPLIRQVGPAAPSSVPMRRSQAIAARTSTLLPSQPEISSHLAQTGQDEARQQPAASNRRAQRAADRAHNNAVLSAAGTDEQIAHSLARDEAQETNQAAERKVRGTKRKMSVRERLAKKLLSGRSVERAQEEQGAVEDEQIRDRNANTF